MRTRTAALALLAGSLAVGAPACSYAQESSGANLIAVGEMAPDFALPGATRFGQLSRPVSLSDYRGKTVVLAFFYRVRTPG